MVGRPIAARISPEPGRTGRGPGLTDVVDARVYGQSLSVGGNQVLISTEPRTHAYMFSSSAAHASIRPQYATAYYGGIPTSQWYTGFAPACEQNDDTSGDHYETPSCGLADMFNQLLLAENGVEIADSCKALLSTPGWGGMNLKDLASTGSHWDRLIEQMRAAARICAELGLTYSVPFLGMMEGEQDHAENTARSWYMSLLLGFAQRYAEEARFAAGQTYAPVIVCTQLASHICAGRTTPTVALAQNDAQVLNPTGIACAWPLYLATYAAAGNVHIDTLSTRRAGAAMGLTAKRRIVDGLTTWNGAMSIVSAVRSGDGIDITLDNLGGIVFDTTAVAALADGNYGIQVVDSGGSSVTVSEVTITGAHVIRAACTAGGGAGSVVRAGWAGDVGETEAGPTKGPRTNIRDSYGDAITFDGYPMHRWLRIEEVYTT